MATFLSWTPHGLIRSFFFFWNQLVNPTSASVVKLAGNNRLPQQTTPSNPYCNFFVHLLPVGHLACQQRCSLLVPLVHWTRIKRQSEMMGMKVCQKESGGRLKKEPTSLSKTVKGPYLDLWGCWLRWELPRRRTWCSEATTRWRRDSWTWKSNSSWALGFNSLKDQTSLQQSRCFLLRCWNWIRWEIVVNETILEINWIKSNKK